MIDQFFLWCVWVLEVIGEVTGMGYELANKHFDGIYFSDIHLISE